MARDAPRLLAARFVSVVHRLPFPVNFCQGNVPPAFCLLLELSHFCVGLRLLPRYTYFFDNAQIQLFSFLTYQILLRRYNLICADFVHLW